MNDAIGAIVAIILAVISVAIVAVIVSKNANTAGVIQAGASGLASVIGAAVAPVTSTGQGTGFSG